MGILSEAGYYMGERNQVASVNVLMGGVRYIAKLVVFSWMQILESMHNVEICINPK